MNRMLLLVLVLGALPGAAWAQTDANVSSAEQMFLASGEQHSERKPLPVTLDFSLPDESEWLAKLNAESALPTRPADSIAAEALSASVDAGVAVAADEPCDPCCSERRWPPAGVFCKHTWEIEYGTSWWRCPIFVASPLASAMVPQIVRLGMMWNDPHPDRRRFRGSWEGIVELDCLPITAGAGTVMIGGSGLIRYNFTSFPRRFTPYFQFGGGGIYTDAFMFPFTPTGSGFNFLVQTGAGGHYWINQKWALLAEAGYLHMSNGGIAGNKGYNVLTTLVGVSYYFGANVN